MIEALGFVKDGVELLDYLRRRGASAGLETKELPGLILLDLNMPRKDGREALKEIKSDPVLVEAMKTLSKYWFEIVTLPSPGE